MRFLAYLVIASIALSGCEMLESKKIDYKSARKLSTLEVPPDLTAPTADNRYAIPDAEGGSATLSAFNQGRKDAPTGAQTLLPSQDKARIERAGSQRWLVVKATPQEVWPVIKDFWQETGFIVNVESPTTGVMETDWAENRAKIPQDGVRKLLGKVIDSLYSTSERDKFRTRIEQGSDGTEIYISHRGMVEVYTSQREDRTSWQPRPSDPELEAEMLRRLMLRFGVENAKAKTLLTEKETPEQARILKNTPVPTLEMDEGFDRAWRRVGLALDRVGFAVEDRDRTKGIYYVRYIDPQLDNESKRDDGLLSKLKFWKSKKTKASPALQINVKEMGEKTQLYVTAEGKPVDNATQNRIVGLLHKELK